MNSPKDNGVSVASSLGSSPEMFDGQAELFEQRTGLPEFCCREIVKNVQAIGRVESADLIVEVGAGTGQVGQWFEEPMRYAGFDLSAGMLTQFSRRLVDDFGKRLLIHADANGSWPIADRAARVIFSSRAMHLVQQEHAANEIFRIGASDGATLILGRVEREPESVRVRLSKEMTERLRKHGLVGRRGERRNEKLFELCCSRGAIAIGPMTIAKWKIRATPRQSLESWRSLSHLGGIPVPSSTRAKILLELESWAEEKFDNLEQEFESEETYVLRSLRLPRTQ